MVENDQLLRLYTLSNFRHRLILAYLCYIPGVKRLDLLGRIRADADRTPQGGLKVPANLTRTGVFTYTYTDGMIVRELRHPNEVFDTASLATLSDATVIVGHPAMVTPSNWKDHAVGHVREAKPNGKFVSAAVVIQDGSTIEKVDAGELVELSCGYDCDLVWDAGVYNGETYDARQTKIRYNHVGMGPRDWGRAGNEVQLKLDSADAAERCAVAHIDSEVNDDCYIPGMKTDAEKLADALAELASVKADAAKADSAKLDTLQAKLDSANADKVALQVKLDAALAAASPEALQVRVDARVSLLSNARKVLGEKLDSKGSDDEVRIAVIVASVPTFDSKDKSSDYLKARFDTIVENHVAGEVSLATTRQAVADAAGAAPGAEDLDKTVATFREKQLNAYKAGAR